MKRERADTEAPSKASSTTSSPSAPPPLQRRTIRGDECGLPTHASVIEEIDEVYEYQTILLRFPCFDFFRNVHLCETTRTVAEAQAELRARLSFASSAVTTEFAAQTLLGNATPSQIEASTSSPPPSPPSKARREVCFAPEALQFVPSTLATDTPIAVLNCGTAHEMVFEGQWSEVSGDGTAVTNRAILHLSSAKPPAAMPQPSLPFSHPQQTRSGADVSRGGTAAAPAGRGVSVPPPSVASVAASSPVASLLPHAVAGVTADDERRARKEQLQGWVYDRVDIPSAVLVMQRVR